MCKTSLDSVRGALHKKYYKTTVDPNNGALQTTAFTLSMLGSIFLSFFSCTTPWETQNLTYV